MVKLVPQYDIELIFNKIRPMIEKALKHSGGEVSAEDVKDDLLNNDKQLWIVVDNGIKAAAVTEVATYPKKRILRILMLGGQEMNSWLNDILDTFDKWADLIRASTIEVIGRKGWQRKLKNYGYGTAYTYLKKEV